MESHKIIQVEEKVPLKLLLPLSIQHMFAMFGASVLVPFIFGINPAIVLFMNGVGTLLFIVVTKAKSPAYLGSSFAFLAPAGVVISKMGYPYALGGFVAVGFCGCILSFIIYKCGTKWIDIVLPPAAMGPVVALIGLELSSSAANNAGLFQMPKEIFPECHEAYEAAGTVNKECAEQTGLKEGIKIAYGGGDTLMQGVGNGIIRPGVLAANIGTSCQISGGFNEPLYDEKFRTNTFCHVKEDLWMLMGAHLSGGVALKWLMNNILEMGSYDEMTSLAATVPAGSEGLVFLPYLSGERTPYNDPNAKGIYFGMTLKHERAHMIRSTMEGIVFGLRTSIEIFKDLGIEYHKIIASGGGARGKLFLEMQADIFDCEIYTNQGNEQACIGAAITAAIAAGEFGNYEEACDKLVHMKDTIVTPNHENQKYYEEQFAIFRELYGHNADLFRL